VFGALTIYASEPAGFGEMETGILASLADDLAFGITALRTRSELRESRQHLERMVHSAPVIIWAVDLRGYYTLADGKLEALGLRTDRVVGRHLKDIVGDHADILDHFGRAIQGEQVTAQVEFCGMILESAYSPLRDEKHQITGVICVSTDITDQRRVEREVLTATEHEQNRIGQDLHDNIQGNLTGIGFMLAAHKQHLLQENRRQADLVTQVDRLASLVTETIKQTRGLARALCPVDLKGDGLAKSLEQLATTTSSLFNVDCHCQCEPLVLLADELAAKQLYHIAQEALNNILKHARARSISIRLDQDKKELILTIEDDGVGMPERAAQAQGMGLRTMNYRARLVGAALTILRGPSGGTTVKCVLPHRAI
jgi:PAS domain S-box-containing protein